MNSCYGRRERNGMSESDISALMEQIRETIRSGSDGALSVTRAREAYKKLLRRYNLIEQKYVSSHSKGFVKGLLYNHNSHNNSNLTALFLMNGTEPVPVAYAGDRLLLAAMPELITREYSSLLDDAIARFRLGEKSGQYFSMIIKKMTVARESIVMVSVSSAPHFSTGHFEYCAGLMQSIFERALELRSPVMMIYSNNISAEISSVFRSMDGGSMHVDQFQLRIPRGSFMHAGIYTLTEFSSIIVTTLKSKYPDSVHIFALSLSTYLVVYGDEIKNSLDLKRNRINLEFHGNSIPYKVEQIEVDSPQSLYLFLEKL